MNRNVLEDVGDGSRAWGRAFSVKMVWRGGEREESE